MTRKTTSETFRNGILEPAKVQSEELKNMMCDIIDICNRYSEHNPDDRTVTTSAALVKIFIPGPAMCFRGGDAIIEQAIAESFAEATQLFVSRHIYATGKMRQILGTHDETFENIFQSEFKRNQ